MNKLEFIDDLAFSIITSVVLSIIQLMISYITPENVVMINMQTLSGFILFFLILGSILMFSLTILRIIKNIMSKK